MPAFLLVAILLKTALMQAVPCRGDAARLITEAVSLGEAFDLAGSAAAYATAERAGCLAAAAPAAYLRGLVAAREADAKFGSAASLLPIKLAIASIDRIAATDPVASAMQLVLRASIPAAQHERPEMALLIEEMLRMESLQLEAKQPPLPVLSAHEAAGYFWLQLHLYDEARRAFDAAAQKIGDTPHVLFGTAKAAAGRRDTRLACAQYQRLLSWWGSRAGSPPEITEARGFVRQPLCAAAPVRPGTRP